MRGLFRSFGVGVLICTQFFVGDATHAEAAAGGKSARLSGRTKDALDRPLSDVHLRLEAADGRTVAETTSGPDGSFQFESVPPGVYSVQGDKADFEAATAIVTVREGADSSADLVLASHNPLDVSVVARKLDEARNKITPSTGSSVYEITNDAIQAQPQGESAQFNQVLLQAPGVAQDSFGQVHVRGDHANLQYRFNGVLLPEGITGFGQVVDSRFIDHVSLITGALPAQYGYRTAGVIELQTKSGAYEPGGTVGVYGGSHNTIESSLEYGGSTGQLSYYVAGDFLYSGLGTQNYGIEAAAPGLNPIHDRNDQTKAFAYVSDLLDPTTRISFITGNYLGDFNIPNIPGQAPSFTVNGISTFNSKNLNETQSEWTSYAFLALQKSIGDLDFQVSYFTRYTKVNFHPDPVGDVIFTGVASHDIRTDFVNGLQGDGSYKLAESHTLRGGFFFQNEHAISNNDVTVLPVDSAGAQTSDIPFSIGDGSSIVGYRYGLYLQDEWQISPKLTLNFGTRWDHEASFIHTGQISPRINVVYKPWEGTTIHAGYARYFTPPPLELVPTSSITKFNGTTNEPEVKLDATVRPERSHYLDVGVIQQVIPGLQLGADAYYKRASNLIDEGQFGNALIFSIFNYAQGYVYGTELTGSYQVGDFTAYANLAYSVARGQDIVSSQFEFSQDELNYIRTHYIYLDHDQRYTTSLGVSYLWQGTRFSADMLTGSGLRAGFANTQKLDNYETVNLGVSHRFTVEGFKPVTVRFDIVNLFDRNYELRTGTGVGVGAPQFGARRSYYVGFSKEF
ncbi:MAG TPA: TonB-dependent receptor [Myxococcota bacterium]|nr:TonB-dependent receptor [Myxococcota bacterium]